MAGGLGNDTYFVDNIADAVVESAGAGTDAVFASVNFGLADNVETLVLQGSADLQGFGNAWQTRCSATAATTSSTGGLVPIP